MKKRLIIVGGVAGGSSCAVRSRRLSEEAEIILFEQGSHVSFASCGLPYYVGDIIKERDRLIVTKPSLFKKRFNIDVRLHHRVVSIESEKKEVEVEDREAGTRYRESYDELLLSPGASPLVPDIDGIDAKAIFTVKTIEDTDAIHSWIDGHNVARAAVIGGGFIGLEMAENLHERKIAVTLIEMLDQLMPQIDPEMAAVIHRHLNDQGVSLRLGNRVTGFIHNDDNTLTVVCASGARITVDMVILSIGVKPETQLARGAGCEIGESGGISVNGHMQTSVPHIWAVGDAVEVTNITTGRPALLPLAGPANRQGRLVADCIFGKPPMPEFRGVQGTFVCGIAGLTIAATGLSENQIKKMYGDSPPFSFEKIHLNPANHAEYYPGAEYMLIKLLFSPDDGKILGAQAIGGTGTEKRIDVISMAIQKGGTVYDLEQAELCYAPQYGAARDPVNIAGMIAANILRGYVGIVHWDDYPDRNVFLLDVRTRREYEAAHLENAVNINVNVLREETASLPRDRDIWVYCLSGQRSYYAARQLLQQGFMAKNMNGGYYLYGLYREMNMTGDAHDKEDLPA
ncbi:MAG: FAD-dependent oxidoreductase [Spirochaetales bacterium]|nr:FAD-dependent oxidoreductase [Spirochaetales bacterium]